MKNQFVFVDLPTQDTYLINIFPLSVDNNRTA